VADVWESLAEPFAAHYATLRGQTRLFVMHQHLRGHLPDPPASVVDVGGGAGDQSLPLARAGYEVTIADPSPAMLERAAARLEVEPPAVAARVRLVETAGDAAPTVLGRFDGVLCHGVLLYVDDPAPLVHALCDLASPTGVVSIMAKNVRSLAMGPASEHDWAGTVEAFDAERQINELGVDTRADSVEGLTAVLAGCGFDVVAWYGVRLFTESWGRHEPPCDPGAPVLAAELEASRRDPYRQLSRLFHLLARRASA
jgi:2-polyprenyl-3-methyl-5-hydroxy-6-metoxy-1,4-benzoquinol methylase